MTDSATVIRFYAGEGDPPRRFLTDLGGGFELVADKAQAIAFLDEEEARDAIREAGLGPLVLQRERVSDFKPGDQA